MPNAITRSAAPRKPMSPSQHRQMAETLNQQARKAIRQHALPRRYPIASFQVASGATLTAQNNTVNIQPAYVGLATKFIIEVNAKVTNNSTNATLTLTPLGISNILARVQFNDLQNNQRINTTGAHLALLASIRRRQVYGAPLAFVNTAGTGVENLGVTTMGAYGNNWGAPVIGTASGAATIAAGSTDTIYGIYEIPLAYSKEDLTGAIYLNVVNATASLQLQFNYVPSVAATGDPTSAIYQGTASGIIASVNATVYQEFFDQLPMWGSGANKQAILPPLDVATIYGIYDTTLTALVQNQDFPVPYANFRDFLSTIVLFDNETNGAYPTPGSDVNQFRLASANFTNIWQQDPYLSAQDVRDMLSDDLPIPVYYFDHRKRPIASTQNGNMQLILNPATVNSGASLRVWWEYFSRINTITGAASLPAN